ncbi:hypothetical protein LB542_05000 [Mesorhizobium sp. BR1-1-9]|uniref:hypothetical protein n=1 Tax=unclassified Mesorhizobium TaxID=325217 RepID=UPI0015E3F9A0|nr:MULTISPECIES: hypothetical protein [unclassified Mesorhizobium]MBZ9811209.1 hypothetical protein [Mesorhizobium sp. ESP-6-2]MBZ9870222.1 hypothetical protein [Mesorhizobium sp. BR1-1-9]MBZ9942186.1 hypothetical protein [Mesorhizobium sp. BR1-1-13]
MWLTLTEKDLNTPIAVNFDQAISMNPHHSGRGTEIFCGPGVGYLVAERMTDIVSRLGQLRDPSKERQEDFGAGLNAGMNMPNAEYE